jgi:hypothetical protein
VLHRVLQAVGSSRKQGALSQSQHQVRARWNCVQDK